MTYGHAGVRQPRERRKAEAGLDGPGQRVGEGRAVAVAWAAVRAKNSYYRALHRRHKTRSGSNKVIVVVQHAILTAIWHMLPRGSLHEDLGPDHCRVRDKERRVRRLVSQFRCLGVNVSPKEAVACRPEAGESRRRDGGPAGAAHDPKDCG